MVCKGHRVISALSETLEDLQNNIYIPGSSDFYQKDNIAQCEKGILNKVCTNGFCLEVSIKTWIYVEINCLVTQSKRA